ncbi:methyl-accepting chemotaxis protein [Nitrospira lenta]|uniref:Globin-coupled methyl-accepting chemotaxis protein (Modular protein) (Modular protein) n=1 Tax=Nitrospira lenta TaxID=1436998 RepID=A0A330L5T6_9BACT|nr:methyl-accepting chemotaxis protein [Nitrospira lenta]SPP65124.1 Globin-coupled methyl-accepting chemotaxis protein (Modular protein) (modular protein) [Nitrospira lenta]
MGLNVGLLESSFALLKPQAEALVSRFYERLFDKYPAVKPMFARTPMSEQKKKLLGSLVLVMQNLRKPETLTPALKQLGARHVAYGTQPAHYGAVAETLLGVMGELAGPAWTHDVKQAWTDALNTIAHIMLEGAREAEPRPASIQQGGMKMATSKKAPTTKPGKLDAKDLAARVDAINRSQAVVEFNLDGTIITANDNFLNCFGYSLDELTGKHHRMFIDPAYAAGPEYQAFWAKLNRGELDAGVYKRLGKGGKELWIQASYNPIMDAKGKLSKVVTFALDVTEEKKKALVKSAMDNSISNVLMCDRNLRVTYINKAAYDKLKALEHEIRKVMPAFNTDTIVGTCIDSFHKAPEMQRRLLDNPNNLPHKADIQLGPLLLELNVGAIISENGEYLGNSLEWSDVTAKRKAERDMATLKNSLDNSTSNVLMCDRNLTITYINKAALNKLKALESEIRKVLPAFDTAKIVGTCIDSFHKVPDMQRRLLGDPKNLPHRADIKLGPLTLSLTVSAIVSDSGEYLGNTLEWADITAQKKAQDEIDKLIGAAAAGELSQRMKAEEFEGFFKSLALGINKMLDAVVSPLHEAQMVLTAMAANDLTKQMTGSYEGEFDQMKSSLNGAIQTLGTALTTVREAAESVTAGAEQITKGNEDLSQRTSEQASSLEETSASMEEMTSTVKQNADNAKQANQLAITARDIADKGGSVTVRAVEAMGEINKSSKKIADIITVIDEIAFQTNLLALNAAVEAARAGEHGRGFAVVAAEVRNLAQRSATAAKEIKGLINESIQRVSDGSELVNQSGKTLEEIVSSVKRVTDIIAEITAASQEQASGIDQVNKAIMQMDETTQQNAALVEETTSASQSMKDQAKELMSQVEVFKTSAEDNHSAPRREYVAATKPAPKPMSAGNGAKAGLKKPAFTSKPAEAKAPVGVGAGNGHDRRRKDDDFEEF